MRLPESHAGTAELDLSELEPSKPALNHVSAPLQLHPWLRSLLYDPNGLRKKIAKNLCSKLKTPGIVLDYPATLSSFIFVNGLSRKNSRLHLCFLGGH
jgi:hypothetical protein